MYCQTPDTSWKALPCSVSQNELTFLCDSVKHSLLVSLIAQEDVKGLPWSATHIFGLDSYLTAETCTGTIAHERHVDSSKA